MTDYNNTPSEDRGASTLSPPSHSVKTEQSVLGGLLLENMAWGRTADIVNGEDFCRHEHRPIFRVVAALTNESHPADVITVQETSECNKELEATGGFNYLISLAQNTPSAANIHHYAKIVREHSIMRQFAEVGTETARNAYNPQSRDASQLLDRAENKVFQIAKSAAKSKRGFLGMPVLLREVVERIDVLYLRDNPDEVTGIAIDLIDLDKKAPGLQSGDLIIVADRLSMSKTAFSISIAEYVAVEGKLPVAVFSMEMGGT